MTENHKNNLAALLDAEAHVKLAKAAWLRDNNTGIAQNLSLVTAALKEIRFDEAEYALAVPAVAAKPKKKGVRK